MNIKAQIFSLFFYSILIPSYSYPQASCEITTTDDNNWLNSYFTVSLYTYLIDLGATSTGGNCTLNATIQYYIEFIPISGNPPPSEISTLQGRVTCNGQSMFFDLPNGPTGGGSGQVISSNSGGHPFNPTHGNCDGYTTSNCNNSVQIEIGGSGISYQIINCTAMQPIALSTRLLSFNVISTDNKNAELTWTTLTEEGTSHYIIEHADESLKFKEIGIINTIGNTNGLNNYSFEDKNLKEGLHYYRVSEVSHTEKKPNPLSLKSIRIQPSETTFTIFPNPANSGEPSKILYTPRKNSSSYIEVYSLIGALVTRFRIDDHSSTHEINLPKGQYLIHLIEDNGQVGVKSLAVL